MRARKSSRNACRRQAEPRSEEGLLASLRFVWQFLAFGSPLSFACLARPGAQVTCVRGKGGSETRQGWSFSLGLEGLSFREKVFAALARMRGCLRACGLLGALKGRSVKPSSPGQERECTCSVRSYRAEARALRIARARHEPSGPENPQSVRLTDTPNGCIIRNLAVEQMFPFQGGAPCASAS